MRDAEADEISRQLRTVAHRVLLDSAEIRNPTIALTDGRARLWRSKQALERTECRMGSDFSKYCEEVEVDIQFVRTEMQRVRSGRAKIVMPSGRHRAYDDRSWVQKIFERYTK